MDTIEILFRAEGYAALEMYAEAWETVERLPVDDVRLQPSIIAVRLTVCTGLSMWETGLELCRCADGSLKPELREAMGRFYLAYAKALSARGDAKSARKYAGETAKVWPEGRGIAEKERVAWETLESVGA